MSQPSALPPSGRLAAVWIGVAAGAAGALTALGVASIIEPDAAHGSLRGDISGAAAAPAAGLLVLAIRLWCREWWQTPRAAVSVPGRIAVCLLLVACPLSFFVLRSGLAVAFLLLIAPGLLIQAAGPRGCAARLRAGITLSWPLAWVVVLTLFMSANGRMAPWLAGSLGTGAAVGVISMLCDTALASVDDTFG